MATQHPSTIYLPFEKPLRELEARVAQSTDAAERRALEEELETARAEALSTLSAWERVQLSRHPARPRMLDYVDRLFDDLIELHGDRCMGDDAAIVAGIGRFQGRTVMVAGQQKGRTTDEKVLRNFGMAHPSGYRKALRVFRLAERYRLPVMCFVDTPAAHPGIEAEQHGQGPAIAENLRAMLGLTQPIYSVVLSEGGSGGALAVAVANWVSIFEGATYLVCPPERCAEILWRDANRKEEAAAALRGGAYDLERLGVVDEVLREPNGGAHRDPEAAAEVLRGSLARFLDGCDRGQWTGAQRQARFRRFGMYLEAQPAGVAQPLHEAG